MGDKIHTRPPISALCKAHCDLTWRYANWEISARNGSACIVCVVMLEIQAFQTKLELKIKLFRVWKSWIWAWKAWKAWIRNFYFLAFFLTTCFCNTLLDILHFYLSQVGVPKSTYPFLLLCIICRLVNTVTIPRAFNVMIPTMPALLSRRPRRQTERQKIPILHLCSDLWQTDILEYTFLN